MMKLITTLRRRRNGQFIVCTYKGMEHFNTAELTRGYLLTQQRKTTVNEQWLAKQNADATEKPADHAAGENHGSGGLNTAQVAGIGACF